MKFGRAAHTRMLEPVTFSELYAIAPNCDRRTNEGKAIWAELQESGKEIISSADMEIIASMEVEFDKIRDILRDAQTELPLIWEDYETAVKCKGRIDAITPDYVIDYKECIEMQFYVRAKAEKALVQGIFHDVKFLSRRGQPSDETAFITDKMTENSLMKKLNGIDVISVIKVTNY